MTQDFSEPNTKWHNGSIWFISYTLRNTMPHFKTHCPAQASYLKYLMYVQCINSSTSLDLLEGTDIQRSWFGLHGSWVLHSITDRELLEPQNGISGGQC